MTRLVELLTATALSAVAIAAGCAPEVMIARSEKTGGSGGALASAGSAGSATSGTGNAPAGGAAGEAGQGGQGDVTLEPGRLLADSVADFSLEQGARGWYYGYDGGSLDTFKLMTRRSVITTYVSPTKDVWDCWANDEAYWTQIFQLGAHANGTNTSPPSVAILQRAVRRWVSSYEGKVVISGEAAKIDVFAMGSNGVDASVYVDGVQLYTTFIDGEDGGGLSYDVAASLHVGSTVDFVIDPHDSDDHHDLSRFTGVIARDVPALGP